MISCYELTPDTNAYPDMWQLRYPLDDQGIPLETNLLPKMGPYAGPRIASVLIDERYPGIPMDFSFGYSNFVMVRSHVADLIEAHGGRIQRFPVKLLPTGETGYEVIFTLDAPQGLIDLKRATEYEFYTQTDSEIDLRYGGVPPRQQGMLYRLYPLYVRPDKVAGLTIFRPWEFREIVISSELKSAFEEVGVSGITYRLAC